MANAPYVKNGWGIASAFMQVTNPVAGVNAVNRNVGVAVAMPPGQAGVRVSKLLWRVDLAPDVPVGTVVSPVRWRLIIFQNQLPADISALQAQAFAPAGARLEIPKNIGTGAPVSVWYDNYLDFGAGSPGLNALASEIFPDGGPSAGPTDFLTALLTPIIDSTIAPAPLGAANALMTLAMYGTGAGAEAFGGVAGGAIRTEPSIPKWDTPHHRVRG
jgi:hypothetical protein